MCGIAGVFDLESKRPIEDAALRAMAQALVHRGPDDEGFHREDGLGFAFRRLSIIDIAGGRQPMYNEDRSIVSVCNGEIYNHRELRRELLQKGHHLRTECDVEVLVHLYEEEGADFVRRLNGQFAFAIYDKRRRTLLLARDQPGIAPLFYSITGGVLLFGSSVKAILTHPKVNRAVDLTGLDQLLSFPAAIAPRTMFQGIHSLPAGELLIADEGGVRTRTYWDLDYPRASDAVPEKTELAYLEELDALLQRSISYRLQADVDVGYYLSGGLDSSLVAGLTRRVAPDVARHSFSIAFSQRDIDERDFQRQMAAHVGSVHHEIVFGWEDIERRMRAMVLHAESPLKEAYDTCSLALSEHVRESGFKVVLSGEGSDELFAGYAGYRFDRQRAELGLGSGDLVEALERELNEKLWGDGDLYYETRLYELEDVKAALYSAPVREACLAKGATESRPVNRAMLDGRDILHKRSYLDFKLRLGNHLLSDHGDRAGYANSVEVRYPFLDLDLIEFVKTVPPRLKFDGVVEKYLLKQAARRYVPEAITRREKFGFVAPGSPYLLKRGVPWLEDLLSYERIKRQGYFNPDTVERLKALYTADNFSLQIPYENDLLMIVITFGLFLDLFELPNFS
jgi:asparagine synthase (glutamine-hydrolysing)